MDLSKILTLTVLTILTGIGDSQGFVHSANVWHNGQFIWSEAMKSAAGFVLGTASFWIAVKFLQEYGVVAAELQTIGWFAITIIGVAVGSGKFLQWTLLDQALAATLLLGIAVLISRTSI